MLFYNAHIYTLSEESPWASYLLIEDGKITALGSGEPDAALFKRASVHRDMQGRALCPAFCDSHIHVWKVGLLNTDWLDVRGTESVRSLQEKLSVFMKQQNDREWIVARGFNEHLFSDPQVPDVNDLNEVSSTRPILLMRTCAHQVVLNSKALSLCGIDETTVSPPGGLIEHDAQGNVNGRLHETALGLVLSKLPETTIEDYSRYIQSATEILFSKGVVAACDPGVSPELMQAYTALDEAGTLSLKANVMPLGMDDSGSLLEVGDCFQSDHLSVDGVKFFADGALSGKTAAVKRAYPGTDTHGILRLEAGPLQEHLAPLLDRGFGVATHAIGDRAIEMIVDLYAGIRKQGVSTVLRVEHCGLPEESAKRLMAEHTIGVCMQPLFLPELGVNLVSSLWPEDKDRCYPLKSLMKMGIQCALSTDGPVVRELRPFKTMEAAFTRSDGAGGVIAPQESIGRLESLPLCTKEALAFGSFGSYKGVLAEGNPGDFLILSTTGDSWLNDTATLPDVEETYADGVCVYKKG